MLNYEEALDAFVNIVKEMGECDQLNSQHDFAVACTVLETLVEDIYGVTDEDALRNTVISKLDEKQTEPKAQHCSSCGTELPANASYCCSCGNKQ